MREPIGRVVFNLPELKELLLICEIAETNQPAVKRWRVLAGKYRRQLEARVAELEEVNRGREENEQKEKTTETK